MTHAAWLKKRAHNFCSKTCSYKWQSINRSGPNHHQFKPETYYRICENCKVIFPRKGGNYPRFCSRKCRWELLGGENHYNWRGGVTPLNIKIRHSGKYIKWRNEVLKRDKRTCQECGETNGRIEVDHIKPFSLFPELRLELSNGRTLCIRCHRKTPTYAGKLKTYKSI